MQNILVIKIETGLPLLMFKGKLLHMISIYIRVLMCCTFFFFPAGVYDDPQLTQLDVKSWAYFLPEQKNPLLLKETKGDEANAKKTEKGVYSSTFSCSCGNLHVSYYVRYHRCLFFIVGGERREGR